MVSLHRLVTNRSNGFQRPQNAEYTEHFHEFCNLLITRGVSNPKSEDGDQYAQAEDAKIKHVPPAAEINPAPNAKPRGHNLNESRASAQREA